MKYLLEERKVDATLLDDRECSALDMAAGYDDIITYLSGYLRSSEQPPAKKPRLDIESVHTEDQLASSDDTNAEYGISTNQEDELGTPAKRLKLSSTMKRDHNVSWMPSKYHAIHFHDSLILQCIRLFYGYRAPKRMILCYWD